MRRVRYSVAMSLDGYIAGPDGEHDWIPMDPEIDFGALMARFDTVLLGRRSWEAARAQGGAGMPGMRSVVFSRTLSPGDCGSALVSDDPARTVAELREEPGKDLWLFGGGALFRSMLDLDLVDDVEIAVIPVLLGAGIPVIAPGRRSKLALVRERLYPRTGTVWVEYARA